MTSAIVQALQSIAQAIQNPFSIFVTSYTNSDPSGGTFYYWRIGPVKFVAGITNSKNIAGSTTVGFQANFPANFFTTMIAGYAVPANMTIVAEQFGNVSGIGTTAITGFVRNNTTTAGTSQMSFLAIGL